MLRTDEPTGCLVEILMNSNALLFLLNYENSVMSIRKFNSHETQ